MREFPTKERILEQYDYDPDTGVFTWKKDGINPLVRIGARAGKTCPDGYRSLSVGCLRFQASWVAWFLSTGEWPKSEIDHVNHDRGDDRFCNLREATRSQNCGYKRSLVGNANGYRGIKMQSSGRFLAVICVRRKELCLGTYDTAEQAALIYDAAAKEHFGQFAILNFPEQSGA